MNNKLTDEQRRVIELLLRVCGAAFELADDSCQQEIDGEHCHVIPDDSFIKLSDALDEIENTLPSECGNTLLQWAAIPRHALRSALSAAEREELQERRQTDSAERAELNFYREITRWIPIDEGLPVQKGGMRYIPLNLLLNGRTVVQGGFDDGQFWLDGVIIDNVTHWMHLPVALPDQ